MAGPQELQCLSDPWLHGGPLCGLLQALSPQDLGCQPEGDTAARAFAMEDDIALATAVLIEVELLLAEPPAHTHTHSCIAFRGVCTLVLTMRHVPCAFQDCLQPCMSAKEACMAPARIWSRGLTIAALPSGLCVDKAQPYQPGPVEQDNKACLASSKLYEPAMLSSAPRPLFPTVSLA